MSSAYRYVIFAAGKQPSVEEMATLNAWATAAKQRYAVGVSSANGCLALAFEAPAFDAACSADGPFSVLLSRWRVRGCEVRERLPFVKQPTALQPMPGGLLRDNVERRSEPALKRKQLAAQEALGRAGLKFQQTLAHHAWIARVATAMPYALMGLGALLTIIAGVYFGQRLLDSPAERRKATIERVGSGAMDEPLMRKAKDSNHQGHKDD